MRLLIAGDLTLQNRAAICQWDQFHLEKSFSEVKNLINDCDHAIVNLESPVTDCTKRIIKDGPTLKNLPSVFDIIGFCNFDCVTLANNHLKDYGSNGVIDTIERCLENQLNIVGAGKNIESARKPIVLTDERVKVGVINICEHESSIATLSSAGSNPLYYPYLLQDIHSLKGQVDKIVVIIHGGREHYQLPTPRMKQEYRMIVDFGADIIINHHQHCFSGYEIYKGRPIIYGIGNFFFDSENRRNNKWNYGLFAMIDINKNKTEFKLIPYEQCNLEAVVRLLDYKKVAQQIEKLNAIIEDDNRLEYEFDKMVMSAKILSPFLPFGNRLLRSFYYRGLIPSIISKKNMALIENAASCETHRELLIHYLSKKIHG